MDLARLNPSLAAKLAKRQPLFDTEVKWPAQRLRQRTYVGKIACPTELASSARAVIFKDSRVVVVHQQDGSRHIEPGGRLQRGETVEATVRRELLEETGWHVGSLVRLGLHHFSPLDEPRGLQPPLSDFLQPLFVTEAYFYQRSARDLTQIERGARLTPIREALKTLPPLQAALLRAASRRRVRTT